jgi:hypothetical protein
MNDDRFDSEPPQSDGWVEDSEVSPATPPSGPTAPQPPRQPQPRRSPNLPVRATDTVPGRSEEQDVDAGKPLALLSHASLLFGIPVFIVPMLQKDNRFALHHGKAAAVNFIFFMIAFGLTMVTCGLAFPLIFLCYIPAIVGVVHAANGELAGTWGWGPAGERMFSGLQVPDEPKQIGP